MTFDPSVHGEVIVTRVNQDVLLTTMNELIQQILNLQDDIEGTQATLDKILLHEEYQSLLAYLTYQSKVPPPLVPVDPPPDTSP